MLWGGHHSTLERRPDFITSENYLFAFKLWRILVFQEHICFFTSVCLCTYFFTAIVTKPCKGRSVLKTKKEWIRCKGQSYLFMELRLIHPHRLKLSVRWCPFHFLRVCLSDNQVQPLVKTLCDLSFSLRGKKISLNHTSVFSVSAPWMNCWDAAFLSASMFM